MASEKDSFNAEPNLSVPATEREDGGSGPLDLTRDRARRKAFRSRTDALLGILTTTRTPEDTLRLEEHVHSSVDDALRAASQVPPNVNELPDGELKAEALWTLEGGKLATQMQEHLATDGKLWVLDGEGDSAQRDPPSRLEKNLATTGKLWVLGGEEGDSAQRDPPSRLEKQDRKKVDKDKGEEVEAPSIPFSKKDIAVTWLMALRGLLCKPHMNWPLCLEAYNDMTRLISISKAADNPELLETWERKAREASDFTAGETIEQRFRLIFQWTDTDQEFERREKSPDVKIDQTDRYARRIRNSILTQPLFEGVLSEWRIFQAYLPSCDEYRKVMLDPSGPHPAHLRTALNAMLEENKVIRGCHRFLFDNSLAEVVGKGAANTVTTVWDRNQTGELETLMRQLPFPNIIALDGSMTDWVWTMLLRQHIVDGIYYHHKAGHIITGVATEVLEPSTASSRVDRCRHLLHVICMFDELPEEDRKCFAEESKGPIAVLRRQTALINALSEWFC